MQGSCPVVYLKKAFTFYICHIFNRDSTSPLFIQINVCDLFIAFIETVWTYHSKQNRLFTCFNNMRSRCPVKLLFTWLHLFWILPPWPSRTSGIIGDDMTTINQWQWCRCLRCAGKCCDNRGEGSTYDWGGGRPRQMEVEIKEEH